MSEGFAKISLLKKPLKGITSSYSTRGNATALPIVDFLVAISPNLFRFHNAAGVRAVPPAFEAVAAEIEEWKQKNAEVINSPYQSESFGGYSYTKGTASWQGVFSKRLNRWRKI